eukprot:m.230909 g.230909  ORF g.230909 m.230909 type:complete len:225 (+) comp18189_c0_seq1:62-736(+)
MDPGDWYKNMPPITKALFTAVVGTTLAANFGLVDARLLLLDYNAIWDHFQIWRLVSCFAFFGRLGFPFLMNVYFLYSYSLRLETGVYEHSKGDYVYMLLISGLVLLLIGAFLPLPILGVPLVIAILYVWCAANAETIVSFWFGTTFKAIYLPWVLAGFNILMGGNGLQEFLGIIAGHVYFFLKYKYPAEHGGASLLETPQFITNFFDPRYRPAPGWGRGRRLDD